MWSDIRPKEHGRTRQKTSLTGVEEQLQLTNWCDCYIYLEGLTEVRTIDERVENVKAGLGVSFTATLQTPGIVGFCSSVIFNNYFSQNESLLVYVTYIHGQ